MMLCDDRDKLKQSQQQANERGWEEMKMSKETNERSKACFVNEKALVVCGQLTVAMNMLPNYIYEQHSI